MTKNKYNKVASVEDERVNKPLLKQITINSSILTVTFCLGVGYGTTTVMIPQLEAKNSTIHVDDTTKFWLYSVQGYAAILLELSLPFISARFGRKSLFTLTCFLMVLSFSFEYFATEAIHLLLSKILQGMTSGGLMSVGVIAIAEYSDPKYRGTFLICKGASFFWGIWLANAIGTYAHWKCIPLVGIWFSLYAVLATLFWPESYVWLASRGRVKECEEAFRKIRGYSEISEKELSALIDNVSRNSIKDSSLPMRIKDIVKLKQFYMPLILVIVIFSLYYFSGKFVCTVYALIIVKDITKDKSTAYTGMLIMDGVTVFGMYVGSYVATKIRRRIMLISTTLLTLFFLYLLSGYLFLVHYEVISETATISISLLVSYSLSVSWGPMVLCTSIYAEIIPLRFKPFLSAVGTVYFSLAQAGNLQMAPFLFSRIGMHGTFAVYGTLTSAMLFILYKYLPETKDKTLEEVEVSFKEMWVSLKESDISCDECVVKLVK